MDEATLRARLVAAPFKNYRASRSLLIKGYLWLLTTDKLANVWATLTTWLKEFERHCYLCAFYDFSKNVVVYGLAHNQQPEGDGQFEVIAAMHSHSSLSTSLSKRIRRSFFDAEKGQGGSKYRIFASPSTNEIKKSFIVNLLQTE